MSASEPASTPRTLWRDEAGGRFFLVPDDAALPYGPLVLRAGLKDVGGVDPAAAAPYEVTREEARAFLDAKLDSFVATTKASVGSFFSALGIDAETDAREPSSSPPPDTAAAPASPASPEAEAPASPVGDASGEAEDNPGVRLFSALTGQQPEAVTSDPAAFLDGLASLLRGAGETLSRAASGGEEGRAEFERKLEALRETLREHGIHAPETPAPPSGPSRDAG